MNICHYCRKPGFRVLHDGRDKFISHDGKLHCASRARREINKRKKKGKR